jgi:uncharacterized membrane protein
MSAERAFLALALLFGIAFSLSTPPYDAPDEPRHFGRAYLISEGRLTPPGQAPGHRATIPRSLVELHPPRPHVPPGYPMHWTHDVAQLRALASRPLAPGERVGAGHLSLYHPALYAAPALAIAAGRVLGFSALGLLATGRIANLLVWVVGTWLAIRWIPFRKWVLALLALTPMSVFQAATLSADAPTNAIACLWTALALRAAYAPGRRVDRRGGWALVGGGALLGFAKPAYWLLPALALGIPRERFASARQRALVVGGSAAAALALPVLWLLVVRAASPPSLAPQLEPDSQAQLLQILQHPLRFVAVLVATVVRFTPIYLETLVGWLGPLEVHLPALLYVAWPLALAAAALTDPEGPEGPSSAARLGLAALFLASAALVLATAYLFWNRVGAPLILGVQGRYFLPVAPLLLLALPAPWRRAQAALGFWVPALAAGGLAVSLVAVLRNYYY